LKTISSETTFRFYFHLTNISHTNPHMIRKKVVYVAMGQAILLQQKL